MSDRTAARRAFFAAILWSIAVAGALLVPLPIRLVRVANSAFGKLPYDKLVHLVLFGLLALSWYRAAALSKRLRIESVALALVLGIGLLEWIQPIVSRRTAELWDAACGAIGVGLALVCFRLRAARKERVRETDRLRLDGGESEVLETARAEP